MAIKILAIYHLAFGVFHLFFWRLLEWNEQLAKLSHNNRAVVQTLNICLTAMFFLVAYCFYFYSAEVQSTHLGRALLVGIGLFWAIRTVLQLILFEMGKTIHQFLFVLFVVGTCLHFGTAYKIW